MSDSPTHAPVLVTGATGKQGGATARALLAAGFPVRAFVRDPAKAAHLEALGATLAIGDLTDPPSIRRALAGARGVFSVQMAPMLPDGFDFAGELTQATTLIDAARAEGVEQFVHTSVTGAGQHTDHPDWGSWPAAAPSLDTKAAIQDHLRAADFPRWTLLKPGFFMENFLPSVPFLFPRGLDAGLITVLKPTTKLSLIATQDIGTTATAAFTTPDRFHRVELELAGDHLSMTDIAAVLTTALGTPITAPTMTIDEGLAAGMPPMSISHDRLNTTGMPGRPEHARALGLPVTPFATWAREHLHPAA